MTLFLLLLVFTIFMNLWTMVNSLFLYPLCKEKASSKGRVSVLIPLRNEEEHVKELVISLKRLTYQDIEFIMLDDQSTDHTYSLLTECTHDDHRFTILTGSQLPEGWNGKVFACHQLSKAATGDYFLFLDADARMAPSTIERVLRTMEVKRADMISGFPFYPNRHFLSHMLVPLQHMVVLLHLPLLIANRTSLPMFTAACGIFMFFKRDAYETIGGHKSVHNSLVEDVHLARVMKSKGYRMILINITSSVLSYMYDSSRETWEGFKKNIFSGIGRSIWIACLLSIFYVAVFLIPVVYAGYGVITGQWLLLLPYLLTVMFKMFVDAKTNHPLWLSFFVPVSAFLLIAILFASMVVHIRGGAYEWKGRSYQ